MAEESREPRVTPRATALDRRVRHGFEAVQSLLLYSVALLLVVFAVLALVSAVVTFGQHLLGDRDYPYAISQGIDTAFLTIILVELLHTVLSRGPIGRQVQEFLVIGITSRRCAIAWRSPPATVAQATAPLPRPRAPTMW